MRLVRRGLLIALAPAQFAISAPMLFLDHDAAPHAALGLLNPILAAAAMTLSSVFVVANSLRLPRYPLPAASKQRPGRRHARSGPAVSAALHAAGGYQFA